MVTLHRTLEYLGLPPLGRVKLEPRNARKYPPIKPATAERLREYFAPHNAALEAMLGEPVRW
jgi:hypothetical protein